MLSFEPPDLFGKIKYAIESIARLIDDADCEFIEDGYNVAGGAFNPNDYEDAIITCDSRLTIALPRCEESDEITYGDLIDLADELDHAELVGNVECWTRKRYLLRVEPVMLDSYMRLAGVLIDGQRNERRLPTEISYKDDIFFCSLVAGYTPFGFIVAKEGAWDKTYPPVLTDDFFVQVSFDRSDRSHDREIIREIAAAYRFELSATRDLDLRPFCRSALVDDLSDTTEEEVHLPQFRKLLVGKGMLGLLELYNQAVTIIDPETRILCFTKVLEYVSQTVVRMQLSEVVRAKLLSPRALDPSADFILELEAIFEEQKSFKRDREAIILAAQICCEATELSRCAPVFLKKLYGISAASKRKDQEDALREFGAALAATRNAVAHAKANHVSTGEECPTGDLWEFANCAKIACQQAIRWYADRPDSARVSR